MKNKPNCYECNKKFEKWVFEYRWTIATILTPLIILTVYGIIGLILFLIFGE